MRAARSADTGAEQTGTPTATTTIGLIGAGNIGGTIARLAVDAGLDVVLSNSRGPATLAQLVDQLGPRARAATPPDAATAGDLVVVAVPLKAYQQVPVQALAGKVVIDTGNYYPERDGQFPELDNETITTAELLAARLPTSHVVKAFGNIFFGHLATMGRPHGASDRSAIAIAGNDETAKKTVTAFLDAIGYDSYDVGPLSEGWRYQRSTGAYAYSGDGSFEDPQPADAARLASVLAQAERPNDR